MAELKVPEKFEHDCNSCMGLCCYAHKHQAGLFPISKNKPGGEPCKHLVIDTKIESELYRCRIHQVLDAEGWGVCSLFNCRGAGQMISKFFHDLGFSWAIDDGSLGPKARKIRDVNMRYGYNLLELFFKFLDRIRQRFGEMGFNIASAALEVELTRLSVQLSRTDAEFDPNYWYRQVIHPTILGALQKANFLR